MAVISLSRNFNQNPQTVNMTVDVDQATVATSGYLTDPETLASIHEINYGSWVWQQSDLVLVSATDGDLLYTLNADLSTLVVYSSGGGGGSVTPLQIQNATFIKGQNSGTGDALVVNLSPALLSYSTGALYIVTLSGPNTIINPTLQIDGLAALPIYNEGTVGNNSLLIGDIPNDALFQYDAQMNVFRLLNSVSSQSVGVRIAQTYYNYGFDIGSVNTYQANINAIGNSFANSSLFIVDIQSDNTGASTLELFCQDTNESGILPIISNNASLVGGELLAGSSYLFLFDFSFSQFILLNSSLVGSGSVSPAQVQENAFIFSLDTGTTNAYEVTLSPAPLAYEDGLAVLMVPSSANTIKNPTINVNGLGAVQINATAPGGGLAAGDISTAVPIWVVYYDGAFFPINTRYSVQTGFTIPTNYFSSGATTGSANTYSLATRGNGAVNNFSDVFVQINATNTDASTLAVTNSSGNTKSGQLTLSNGDPVLPGMLEISKTYHLIGSGADWSLSNTYNPPTQFFAGDPNTNVAGNFLTFCVDTANQFLYYCDNGGDASTATWTKIIM